MVQVTSAPVCIKLIQQAHSVTPQCSTYIVQPGAVQSCSAAHPALNCILVQLAALVEQEQGA